MDMGGHGILDWKNLRKVRGKVSWVYSVVKLKKEKKKKVDGKAYAT